MTMMMTGHNHALPRVLLCAIAVIATSVHASLLVTNDGTYHLPEPLLVQGVNVTAQLEQLKGRSVSRCSSLQCVMRMRPAGTLAAQQAQIAQLLAANARLQADLAAVNKTGAVRCERPRAESD
jgi:hypothetical protein